MTVSKKSSATKFGEKSWEDDAQSLFTTVIHKRPFVVIVPKRVLPGSRTRPKAIARYSGNYFLSPSDIAKKLDLSSGYRVVINNGPRAGGERAAFAWASACANAHSLAQGLSPRFNQQLERKRTSGPERLLMLANKRPVIRRFACPQSVSVTWEKFRISWPFLG